MFPVAPRRPRPRRMALHALREERDHAVPGETAGAGPATGRPDRLTLAARAGARVARATVSGPSLSLCLPPSRGHLRVRADGADEPGGRRRGRRSWRA